MCTLRNMARQRRRPMGSLTVRAMRDMNVEMTWALAAVATAVAVLGYLAIGWVAQKILRDEPPVILAPPKVARRGNAIVRLMILTTASNPLRMQSHFLNKVAWQRLLSGALEVFDPPFPKLMIQPSIASWTSMSSALKLGCNAGAKSDEWCGLLHRAGNRGTGTAFEGQPNAANQAAGAGIHQAGRMGNIRLVP